MLGASTVDSDLLINLALPASQLGRAQQPGHLFDLDVLPLHAKRWLPEEPTGKCLQIATSHKHFPQVPDTLPSSALESSLLKRRQHADLDCVFPKRRTNPPIAGAYQIAET